MHTITGNKLLEAVTIGAVELNNRVVMAPMTRCRAEHETKMPTPMMETYYEQRASAGLIISEGIVISPMATGYIKVPGLYNVEQVAAWKKITGKVHAKGGKIFAQLWHVGRVSHPDLLGGQLPLAPSAINPQASAYTPGGLKDTVTPKEMSVAEIKQTIGDFKQAAINAMEAGFDGVEIHGANSYLIHQFIAACANQRHDEYGGSAAKRAAFLFEVLEAVTAAIGSGKVGLRLTPIDTGVLGITMDDSTRETFDHIIQHLDQYQLAYLHLGTALIADPEKPYRNILAKAAAYKKIYNGNIIVNRGFDKAGASAAIEEGQADLVAFGVPFIANPDLVERFRHDLPLNKPDMNTFYQGEEKGYTDYTFVK